MCNRSGFVALLLIFLVACKVGGHRSETTGDVVVLDPWDSPEARSYASAVERHLNTGVLAEGASQVFADDRATVESAVSNVLRTFQSEGYSFDDAAAAVAFAWYSLRVASRLPADTSLPRASLETKATMSAKLIVMSAPDSASITVDGRAWPYRTNSSGWADLGARRVRVTKPGLSPAEATCDIRRGVLTTFTATLLVTGSTAQC